MPGSQLHQDLIAYACRTEGWSTAQGWREAFIKRAKSNPEWRAEIPGEYADAVRGCRVRPDAWRLSEEGPSTPGAQWSYNVLVLELLEVEVMHGINNGKREDLLQLFWALDASDSFYLRVWHMDRFGVKRVYLDETTVYTAENGGDPIGWIAPS